MLMMGLLAAAVMVAIGFFMRKRAAGQQAQATQRGGMQYAHETAGMSQGTHRADQGAQAYKVAMPAAGSFQSGSGIGSGIASGIGAAAGASRVPADFDSAGFERNAKANFIRLQAANDANDLDDIRKFTTPGMFAELEQELANRGTAVQKTEVLSINAEVIEVVEDVDHYVVSVRFNGVISDGGQEPDESFDEVWHLMKARQDNSGWVLSGIQQTS
jgi:predicted lipid-binding transport protein (Tim44 family)